MRRYPAIRTVNATSALGLGYIPLVLSGAAPAVKALFQDAVVWDAFIAVAGLRSRGSGLSVTLDPSLLGQPHLAEAVEHGREIRRVFLHPLDRDGGIEAAGFG